MSNFEFLTTLCKNSPILFSVAVSIERKRIDNFTKYSQIISTHLLIMEVDFCSVLCILEVPVLQAFRGISHFVWYCKAVSDLS